LKKSWLSTVVILAVGLIGLLLPFGSVQANPPGVDQGLQLAYKFNYHAVPPGANPSCGSGHKVFTRLGTSGVIEWTLDTDSPITILDCLTISMDGDNAVISVDAADTYIVFVRILGANKNDNNLDICRSIDQDYTICELGSVSLSRTGLDRFQFPKKLFADGAQGEFWQLEPGTGFRIAEIRLYLPK
jgi:hypothetical protein